MIHKYIFKGIFAFLILVFFVSNAFIKNTCVEDNSCTKVALDFDIFLPNEQNDPVEEPTPFKNSAQQKAFNKGIRTVHRTVQRNKILLHDIYNLTNEALVKFNYTQMEMVAILLAIYNHQSIAPFLVAKNHNIAYDIIGEQASTAHDFLAADLPTAEVLIKLFHSDPKEWKDSDPIKPTLGYNSKEELDVWTGIHKGNWFTNPILISDKSKTGVYQNSAEWFPTKQEGEKMIQKTNFHKDGTTDLKLEGFNAFYKNAPYIVGLDSKKGEVPYSDGKQLAEISNAEIQNGAHVGYSFKKGAAEFIFWVTNNGEAFLEGTVQENGVRKRVSVSTNGGVGMWHINKT